MSNLRSILRVALICLCAAGSLQAAAVTLLLNPPSGTLLILPGQSSGWDFTLDNQTPDWISVTSSALTFETNPSLGVYSDFIGLQGGPLPSFAVAPFGTWSQSFNGINQGLGSYTASSGATPFAEDAGSVQVNFDVFNGDPTIDGVQTGSSSVSARFAVDIEAAPASEVPEPSTVSLSAAALLISILRWRRLPAS